MASANVDWQRVLGPLAGPGRMESEELEQLEHARNQPAPRAIRLRPNPAPEVLPFAVEPVPWYSAGRVVQDSDTRPGAFLNHAAGDYFVQDAGSMLALRMCEVRPGQTVCDTCAAPGGKATGLLEHLGGTGILVANEVIGARLTKLRPMMHRSGYSNYLIMNLDVDRLVDACGPAFDCVLVDAPCTGQSMVARGKQKLGAFSSAQIKHSCARQQRIMVEAARLVRPGGRLVYSTCTYAYEENEFVVEQFLAQHAGWRCLEFDDLRDYQSPILEGCYRLWPHQHPSDGAFSAALVNVEGAEDQLGADDNGSPSRAFEQRKGGWEFVEAPQLEWMPDQTGASWIRKQDEVHLLTSEVPDAWIKACHSATPIAVVKQDRLEPHYAAARLLGDANVDDVLVLKDEQACRFVEGESLRVGNQGGGWRRVHWRDRPLAWGKLTAGTLKNHFPKALRQRAVVAS